MTIAAQLAKHMRDLHFGGNWTAVNLRRQLKDVTWEEAVTEVHGFNTIAKLAFHIHYYIREVGGVLAGKPLQSKDSESYAHPPITNQEEWEALQAEMWTAADAFADLLAQLPDEQLLSPFIDEKYGNYFININGIIEHSHYHMGQITLVKKLVRES